MELYDIYRSIIENMTDGAYFVDRDRKIQFWNHAAEEITGYKAEEIVGKNCPESMLHHVDEKGKQLCQEGCPLFATCIDGKQRKERVFVRHKDGYRLPVRVNVYPIYSEGEIVGSVELFNNDTPKVFDDAELEETVAGTSMRDRLTGLPNRPYIESFLGYKMSEYRHFGRMYALVFAALDDFETFTKKNGGKAATDMLTNISSGLLKNIRKTDLIGRWENGEYVGVYSISKGFDAPIFAERIRNTIVNTEVEKDGGILRMTASIGVTVPKPSDSMPNVVRRAIKLMQQSIEAGGARVTVDPKLPK